MKTKPLVTTAMLLSIGAVLSIIQPFQLPFGGGITIASMMPIVIIAYIYGTKHGLFAAFVYSLIQMLIGIKTVSEFFIPGDAQMALGNAICVCFLDYIFAYTVIGFGGIFKNVIKKDYIAIALGAAFALLLRYVVHIISGVIFFGAWAEWFFSQEGFYAIGKTILAKYTGLSLSVIYSIFYNGLYMIPEIIITTFVTPVVYNVLSRSGLIDNNQ